MNIDPTRLCLGCMVVSADDGACTACGYDRPASVPALVNAPGIWISSRYLIGRVLGEPGGFGITYLGWDAQLERRVAIKEYLPRDLAGRDPTRGLVVPHTEKDATVFQFGLSRFLDEARTLARFDHDHIVRVQDFFEANGTGYLVMSYYAGITLAQYVEQRGGRIPWQPAVEVLLVVLDAVRHVHAGGILHRDIKPSNVYLTNEGRPILIDFGAARMALGDRSKSMSMILTEGYAPLEQYGGGRQGPWTDVYACGATLYRVITGHAPPSAIDRIHAPELPEAALRGLPGELVTALRAALEVDQNKRCGSAEVWQALLDQVVEKLSGKSVERQTGAVAPAIVQPTPAARPAVRNTVPAARPAAQRLAVPAAVVGALVVAAGGATWMLSRPSVPATDLTLPVATGVASERVAANPPPARPVAPEPRVDEPPVVAPTLPERIVPAEVQPESGVPSRPSVSVEPVPPTRSSDEAPVREAAVTVAPSPRPARAMKSASEPNRAERRVSRQAPERASTGIVKADKAPEAQKSNSWGWGRSDSRKVGEVEQ